MSIALDTGWNIPLDLERTMRHRSVADLGKDHMPIGYYRIDCQRVCEDTLLEFDTVHFVNVTRKTNIKSLPYMIAQLRHGEVVHVYGTGENNANFHNEEGTEVAPLLMLRNGRRRVHVQLPYFDTTDQIRGWMTAGAWMVPMKMCNARPFQLLTSNFTVDCRGATSFSWDRRDGPFMIHQQLNAESALCPAWMLPVTTTSAFQFTSALGYLDIARMTVPRTPRLWQPRGRAGDYELVRDLEEALLQGGGVWTQNRILARLTETSRLRRNLEAGGLQTAFSIPDQLRQRNDTEVQFNSRSIAVNAEFLARLQEHYPEYNRHLDDDDWED
jgi:hypothetical protein